MELTGDIREKPLAFARVEEIYSQSGSNGLSIAVLLPVGCKGEELIVAEILKMLCLMLLEKGLQQKESIHSTLQDRIFRFVLQVLQGLYLFLP